jgi:hypothetical protein
MIKHYLLQALINLYSPKKGAPGNGRKEMIIYILLFFFLFNSSFLSFSIWE